MGKGERERDQLKQQQSGNRNKYCMPWILVWGRHSIAFWVHIAKRGRNRHIPNGKRTQSKWRRKNRRLREKGRKKFGMMSIILFNVKSNFTSLFLLYFFHRPLHLIGVFAFSFSSFWCYCLPCICNCSCSMFHWNWKEKKYQSNYGSSSSSRIHITI